MINEFIPVTQGIVALIDKWEVKLSGLPVDVIEKRKNNQMRTIKQILGHLSDSASNNIHRIVHLQYQQSPLPFPNYATEGNNDRWIAIQNYEDENWENLIRYWKYSTLHLVHVIGNIKQEKLGNEWMASPDNKVSLREMVLDYLHHFELHLNEIDELINKA